MNIKELDTITTADEAREAAIDWQAWQAEQEIGYGELVEWQAAFEALAYKFDLLEEFEENGVI